MLYAIDTFFYYYLSIDTYTAELFTIAFENACDATYINKVLKNQTNKQLHVFNLGLFKKRKE